MEDLLFVIPAEDVTKEKLTELLRNRPEIKFVSPLGIDLAGNDTDAKIPVERFLQDMDSFFDGSALQTDGSSVVLTGIATLNNAKVDMVADNSVNWYVDYNYEFFDRQLNKPVGTLRIPVFLLHGGKKVDSRSVLAESMEYVRAELLDLFRSNKNIAGLSHVNVDEIEDIVFTVATELEFWVKTPTEVAEITELSASQVIQEQYWQRTRGIVRSALERSILILDRYGLHSEMGHKETGGVKATIDRSGHLDHVMEQLEIDWRFSTALQAADNELLARIVIREVFRATGLDVVFKAKPIIGVAGSGEHTHIGIAAKMKSSKMINLFASEDMKKDFMSSVGYGALMGILKNYEAINPFISATNDSLQRLKPGFEAPVCIVTSLGHTPEIPSRNRTILVGLVRDVNNPLATRFEVRSPNPYTNTYIAVAVLYLAMLDGIKACINKSIEELDRELSKSAGEEGFYLEQDRAYRSEEDIFDDYTAEERDRLFGKHPATVWENMQNLDKYPEKVEVFTRSNVLRKEIIDAFVGGALIRWKTEILNRIIPENLAFVKAVKPLHDKDATDMDLQNWKKIAQLRYLLAKDSVAKKSIFTNIKDALNSGDYETASRLQLEMFDKITELKDLYAEYERNILIF
ncbi:glutamine synthetase [Selenomonadales bacterium OttesenSCG-928-I06]|nr:glutamine synthetase [Selenomonadales bacterium OttesenSCG-928-I06]